MTTLLKRQMLSDGNRARGNSQKKKSSILSLWHILVKRDWKTTIERMLLDHSLFTIQVQTTLKRNTIIWGSRLIAFYFAREWRSHKVILQRLLWDAAGEHRTQELSPNLRKQKQYYTIIPKSTDYAGVSFQVLPRIVLLCCRCFFFLEVKNSIQGMMYKVILW